MLFADRVIAINFSCGRSIVSRKVLYSAHQAPVVGMLDFGRENRRFPVDPQQMEVSVLFWVRLITRTTVRQNYKDWKLSQNLVSWAVWCSGLMHSRWVIKVVQVRNNQLEILTNKRLPANESLSTLLSTTTVTDNQNCRQLMSDMQWWSAL